ncbi:molybdopterin-dependent oxidoreductase [Streptomyces sp. NPDC048550]|uniref:molybdopterin-dependent oxidoreductase n=1 Tax=Streptomyces sp. NPDC048550 TaxID=3155739 RepID=UPI00342FA13A
MEQQLEAGRLAFACEDPDDPVNWPRVLTVWRANLIGSSAKGNEYFLRHLLGADDNASAAQAPQEHRPREVAWREEAPRGKLDLLLALDFRMTSTTLFADLVLPAATWYEKHDLSSTDMHPFVHAFSPAIDPPWQARTDFEIFHGLAAKVAELAHGRLEDAWDLVATALQHDTPGEAPPEGPTQPQYTLVKRDYTALADQLAAFGPLPDEHGMQVRGITVHTTPESHWLAERCGTAREGAARGRPMLDTDVKMCEAILALSGTTNGRVAAEGFRQLGVRCGPGSGLEELAASLAERRIVFSDTQARPVQVGASFEWSGKEGPERRYAPFTINTDRGRQRQRRGRRPRRRLPPHAARHGVHVPRPRTPGERAHLRDHGAARRRPQRPERLLIKPTHLIGGHAQLCFAPNYYGPTGNQRDAVTVIRRRSEEVTY